MKGSDCVGTTLKDERTHGTSLMTEIRNASPSNMSQNSYHE